MEAQEIAVRLGVAVLFGGLIGFERQWRQRMAGLRTNSLVAIGAAGFVVFSTMVSGDNSPTRVAAQVVSGVGFLGAGVILREGINITGLNTAATLWCSAMVGTFAGGGQLAASGIAAGFVVLTNLFLRPLVRLINRQPRGAAEIETHYSVELRCQGDQEAHIRALLLQAASAAGPRPAPADQRKSRRFPASHGQRAARLGGPQRQRSRTDHRPNKPRAVCHRRPLAGRPRGGRELKGPRHRIRVFPVQPQIASPVARRCTCSESAARFHLKIKYLPRPAAVSRASVVVSATAVLVTAHPPSSPRHPTGIPSREAPTPRVCSVNEAILEWVSPQTRESCAKRGSRRRTIGLAARPSPLTPNGPCCAREASVRICRFITPP